MLFSRILSRLRPNRESGRKAVSCALIFLAASIGTCVYGAPDDSAVSLDQQSILRFLNRVMEWYQHQTMDLETAVSPADVVFANENLPAAEQVVHFSFDFARAGAQLLDGHGKPLSADSRVEPLRQMTRQLETEEDQAQTQLRLLQQQLDAASRKQRQALQSQIAKLNSEVAMRQAQLDTLHGVLGFNAGASADSGGLTTTIDALERSLPANGFKASQKSTTATANQRSAGALAIWTAASRSIRLSGQLRTINGNMQRTDNLLANIRQLRTPLRSELESLVQQGNTIASQPISEDPAVIAQQKKNLDAVTARFKLNAAAVLPLSKQEIVLDVYRKNLDTWYDTTKREYSDSLKSLAIRAGILAVAIAVVFVVFELWRKAILRYVPDYRRRYQFMLLRRIVLWFVVALVILLGFINQFGSFATYAGLMTAGVAVALQNVILAVVGYFMLIGKFGVGVGDRVQVSGVAGQVVDIGLIRMQVMELTGTGTDAQPTGRIIGIPNSIVFQTAAGLFRQVPGASFVWRETSFTLAADSNYREVERRMLTAVETAFGGYRANLERLGRQMEKSLTSIAVGPLAPKLNFKLTPAGLEVTLRFPVEMRIAEEMDDRVTRELLRAIDIEPKLKIVAAEVPVIALRSTAATTTTSVA